MSAPVRLLIVVNVFNPDRGGGGAIFSDLAYGLVQRGFDVTVRCAYPYYPEWTDKSGANGWRVQRYVDQGVHVERNYIYIPRNPNSLFERLLYEASFLFSLLRGLPRGGGYDAVMVYCPLVGAVAFAVVNKLLWRKPLWLNVQDLSADAAAASGIAKGRWVVSALKGVQSFLFNRADVWSTISPVMMRRLAALRRREQPMVYLPNWLNQSMADAIAATPADKTVRPSAPLRLLYAGNIGKKQDLLRFCQCLHNSDVDFEFRVHGNGGGAPEIAEWIANTKDPRFRMGDFMEEPEFAAALAWTDMFVITEKTGSGGSFIPCKTISGLAAGRPILAVCDDDSPLAEEMQLAGCGPLFTWDELSEIPQRLRGITPEAWGAWSANAATRADFYARDRVIDECAAALKRIADR